MQPRVKSKLWANDTLITPAADQNGKVREQQTPIKKKSTEKSTLVDSDEDDETEKPSDGQATDNHQIPARDGVASDMDYFKSRVKKNWSDSDSGDSDDGDDNDDNNDDDDDKDDKSSLSESIEEPQEEAIEEKQGISREDSAAKMLDGDEKEAIETSRLFVRNLPYTATYSSFS